MGICSQHRKLRKEFHIRSSLDTPCTNSETGPRSSIFYENACIFSLLKLTSLTCYFVYGILSINKMTMVKYKHRARQQSPSSTVDVTVITMTSTSRALANRTQSMKQHSSHSLSESLMLSTHTPRSTSHYPAKNRRQILLIDTKSVSTPLNRT